MKWDVSIGIPVHNGEDRLNFLLESLVKNHSGVKEIIISDNASTDGTKDICEKYITEYPKLIHYIRQEKLIPAMENFKKVLNYTTGKYAIIMGHHDLISNNYFDVFVPMLENNPSSVSVMPMIYYFGNNTNINNAKEILNPCKTKLSSPDKKERLYAALQHWSACNIINQLYRTSVLKQIADNIWKKEYIHSDCIQPIYSVLLGECCTSDKAAYYYWIRENETNQEMKERLEKSSQIKIPDINSNGYIPRLNWELCKKYASEFADDILYNDIEISAILMWIACYNNEYWAAYNEIVYNKTQTHERRAYNTIYLALEDERRRLLYKQSITGTSSVFYNQAEQLALRSYAKMLEILINEQYLFPKYKLNKTESELLAELINLKSQTNS